MLAFITGVVEIITRYLLHLTLYDMIRSSSNFEDVKAVLNERTNWTIEVLRSVLAIPLANGSHFVTLCSLLFLIMAESIHLNYGRLTPRALKERVENMGYATFSFLIAMLDISVAIIRIAGIFTVSGSPGLAMCFIFFSAAPSTILPLLTYLVTTFRPRVHRPAVGQGEIEGGVAN